MNRAWAFHLRAQPGGNPGWQWVRCDRASGSVLASLKRFSHLMDCFDDASRYGFAGWAKSSLLSGRKLPQRACPDGAANVSHPSPERATPALPRPVRGS